LLPEKLKLAASVRLLAPAHVRELGLEDARGRDLFGFFVGPDTAVRLKRTTDGVDLVLPADTALSR